MKRASAVFLILVIILSAVMLSGCSESRRPEPEKRAELDLNRRKYPVYHSLDEEGKRIYGLLYNAMISQTQVDVSIGTYASREEMEEAEEWIDENFRQIVYEQPDFFWIDPYTYTLNEMESVGQFSLSVSLSYLVDTDNIPEMKERYDERVSDIVEEAKKQSGVFDRVLYVYDEILLGAEYDESLLDGDESTVELTAYGCLVEGRTVCSGYTLAFVSVMQKLNIECGSEFNSYEDFSIIDGHVWNYCKLDDEYYYFDLTWDDSIFDAEEYKPYLDFAHSYFAVNEDQLVKTNFTMQSDAPTPDCNGTRYNYFVYKGANVSEYEPDIVREMIEAQADEKYIALRFDSYSELLEAETDLMKNSKIYDILGADNISYVITDDCLHMYIFAK